MPRMQGLKVGSSPAWGETQHSCEMRWVSQSARPNLRPIALLSPQRARLRRALSAPCPRSLLPAFHAFAPPRRNDIAIVVVPVIVGDLISGPDGLDRSQDDLALCEVGFCIWPA